MAWLPESLNGLDFSVVVFKEEDIMTRCLALKFCLQEIAAIKTYVVKFVSC